MPPRPSIADLGPSSRPPSGEPLAAAPRAAYVHVPFCRRRCGYCNFTLVAGRDDLVAPYLEALARELELSSPAPPLDTLFFGGGTPSHLSRRDFQRLSASVLARWPLGHGYEWSVEANPNDVDAERAALFAALGVNRVSLGAQSFAPAKLRRLERDHTARDVRRAVEHLRRAGCSVALDLIFGAPDETVDDWEQDLNAAVALRPDHLSTYGLTYERGTRFWGRHLRGECRAVGEELEALMYERAIDLLRESGFEHYEVSNFARPGHRCRHNETYWTGGEYFGVGAGAASYLAGTRRTNHRSPFTYLRRLQQGRSPVWECETLSAEDRARERLVFGLRRLEGISRSRFAAQTGFCLEELVEAPLARYRAWGLLTDDGETVRLTRRGLFISDALWPVFLAPPPAA